MLLLACATEMEAAGLPETFLRDPAFALLHLGVGPVESTLRLTSHLERLKKIPKVVFNFGVGGAYPGSGLQLLDVCLAESEVLGDLGVETAGGIELLAPTIQPSSFFSADFGLLAKAVRILKVSGLSVQAGPFVTVSCSSGTGRRGEMLREKYDGICENMEGGAVARVCSNYRIPFLEVRCISNMVEDRDTSAWRLREAAYKAAQCAVIVAEGLANDPAAASSTSP